MLTQVWSGSTSFYLILEQVLSLDGQVSYRGNALGAVLNFLRATDLYARL